MPRHRTFVAVTIAVMAVVASSVAAANAAPESGGRSGSAESAQQPSGGAQEYVVAFDGDAAAAEAAIADAGGSVVDVNEAANIALVETTDTGFVGKARAEGAVTGVARNHAVGTTRPGVAHRFATERPSASDRAIGGSRGHGRGHGGGRGDRAEPLADLQWDMAMINTDAAHRKATGKGVDVGIIDTGIDASHPDIAPNFDRDASVNCVTGKPDTTDGAWRPSAAESPHGTHVAAA